MQLHALEPLFKFFYLLKFVFMPTKISPGKLQTKLICGKSKASVWRNLSTGTAQKICL